jgi:hypothetical protein
MEILIATNGVNKAAKVLAFPAPQAAMAFAAAA